MKKLQKQKDIFSQAGLSIGFLKNLAPPAPGGGGGIWRPALERSFESDTTN